MILARVRHIAVAGCPPPPYLCGGDVDGLSLIQPQHLYHVTHSQFLGQDLGHAMETGWRYLVAHGGTPVAGADAVLNQHGEYVFAALGAGSFVMNTLTALERAEAHANQQSTQFEQRIVGMGWLYFSAVWLKDLGGHDDVYLPILSTPRGLDPIRFYTPAQLLSALT